jgi:hypothetical protein
MLPKYRERTSSLLQRSVLESERSAPVFSVNSEYSLPQTRLTQQDSYDQSEVKKEEKHPQDTHLSKRAKMSGAAVFSPGNGALRRRQEQEEPRDPIDSTGQLPLHLQKMVDAFYVVNVLNAKNGPCSPTLKASEIEMDDLGKLNIFVHGRTGEPLEARRYLIRKSKYVLVVSGPSLPRSSIIRCYPRETGVRGITAWMVWKGLEGVERNFLIFKVVGTSFTLVDGKKRKELSNLQNNFKGLKRDPFVQPKAKFTRKKLAKQAADASEREKPRDVDTTEKLQQSNVRNLPNFQVGNSGRFTKTAGAFKGPAGDLVDVSEDSHAMRSVTSTVKYGKFASALNPKPNAESAIVPSKVAEPAASSSHGDAVTKLGSPPSIKLLPLSKREKTFFCFVNSSDEVKRTRRFDTCDSVGKLFLQAEVGGLVQKSDEEAALSLVVPGTRSLVVPNKDDESFKELVEAIAGAEILKKGQESASCRVEVRAYA